MLTVLYEDNHCLAVNKPARLLTMGDSTGDESLVDQAREYIRQKYHKPGQVYVGVVHRLDRPVSGVVLLARTSKGAARLSEQFREGTVTKVYQALVTGPCPTQQVTWRDWLLKHEARNTVRCVAEGTPGARESVLSCRPLDRRAQRTLVEVTPLTGRSHQIRVQLSHHRLPIVGDAKYGSTEPFREGCIALHASALTFRHPTRDETITVAAPVPGFWR
jgi:23S rRNA pseudouridine1911/1915/1917 synthase